MRFRRTRPRAAGRPTGCCREGSGQAEHLNSIWCDPPGPLEQAKAEGSREITGEGPDPDPPRGLGMPCLRAAVRAEPQRAGSSVWGRAVLNVPGRQAPERGHRATSFARSTFPLVVREHQPPAATADHGGLTSCPKHREPIGPITRLREQLLPGGLGGGRPPLRERRARRRKTQPEGEARWAIAQLIGRRPLRLPSGWGCTPAASLPAA